MTGRQPANAARQARLGGAVVAAAGAAMVWWSWGTWPDVLVDFGRELYLPWQITEGKVLYRDLASFNGPLSPYVNAAWFRLFGTSLRAIVIGNLLLLALLTTVLYRLLLVMGGVWSAVIGGLVFVTLFACAQLVSISNYNFVCPYSHELTHGIVLAVVSIWCFWRFLVGRRLMSIAATGATLGLSFLTKPEVFAAILAGTSVGLVVLLGRERFKPRVAAAMAATWTGSVIAPILLAIVLLSREMTGSEAMDGVLGPWRPIVDSAIRQRLTELPFYRGVLGVNDLPANLLAMAYWIAGYGLLLIPAYLAAIRIRPTDRHRHTVVQALIVYAGLLGVIASTLVRSWPGAARPLPVFMVVWLLALAFGPDGNTPSPAAAHRQLLRLVWATFSLTLLVKVAFNATFAHYGFALVMPGALGLVTLLLDGIPASIERRTGFALVFRGVAAVVVLIVVIGNLMVMSVLIVRKGTIIGTGPDRFRADDRGAIANAVLADIGRRLRPDQTLLVVPEGVTLNYLARRASPTRYVNFMPPELALFGEYRILATLRQHPADYVAVVHKDTSEYGVQFFGQDYGRTIMSWIEAEYRPASLFGHEPLRDNRFGILLMRRRSLQPSPPGGR